MFGETGKGPSEITVDKDGNVYSINSWDNTVTKITPDGKSSVFGTAGSFPRGIAIDRNGNVYTAHQ